MGIFYLNGDPQDIPEVRCKQFLLNASTSEALDIIELSFWCIEGLRSALNWQELMTITQDADDAVKELNHRFKEHGVGYEYVGGEIVHVDSQYVHAEAVKPAISLLKTAGFDGALDEFFKAHKHYRKGRNGEAMSEALKAFESTMKAICEKNGWQYDSNAPAKRLIEAVLDNELVPHYMQSHFTGLRQTLEAGLPTVRNKNSGHGQGMVAKQVPDHLAGYALHLAATNIVFLVEAHEALTRK